MVRTCISMYEYWEGWAVATCLEHGITEQHGLAFEVGIDL
jgi:hypothetical protein